MAEFDSSTVTLFFSDIEGSTRLLQRLPNEYPRLLDEIQQILVTAFEQQHGRVMDTQGDSFFVAFPRALNAVNAAVQAQRALSAHDWGEGVQVRVRMGLHTGEPALVQDRYIGIDVHRAARIGAAAYGGQVLLSETTHALIKEELPPGVSVLDIGEHKLKDMRAPQRLYQLVIAGVDSSFPPLKTLLAIPNNLPNPLTSFIGREREIQEICNRLNTARLVTLTGTGGAGKTRLALQAARILLDTARFQNGVWFVELASLSNPQRVEQEIATALGVRDESGNLLETLCQYVSAKTLLLVLDNCEHLIDACARLTEMLLHAAPGLRMLATSRERLNIPGETVVNVASLPLPATRDASHLETLMANDAARLFVERATMYASDFHMTTSNAPYIAQICRRLDGIPLAIELAAARVTALTVEEIAPRLDDIFRLLTSGSRTALPHQQTLAAAIDWSYNLLSQDEQILLRQLSVFAGGWNLDAIERVAGDGINPAQVLDLLTMLVNKSLVMVERGSNGKVRYRLLETIRQFARYRLFESNEEETVSNRHLDFFTDVAERSVRELHGPQQQDWLLRLDLEHENLRAALSWALEAESARASHALRLTGALWMYWDIRGYLDEGMTWCERALASTTTKNLARVQTLIGAGGFAARLGNFSRLQSFADQALTLARELNDLSSEAELLLGMGMIAAIQGDAARAHALQEQSLSLWYKVGDKWGIAHGLGPAASNAQDACDYPRAIELFETSLTFFREVGDKREVAGALANLAGVITIQGNLEPAKAFAAESLELYEELQDKHGIATALRSLGLIARDSGDWLPAREFLDESISIFSEMSDKGCRLESTVALAELMCAQGEIMTAVQLGQQNLTLAQELNWTQGALVSRILLARIAILLGDLERARSSLINLFGGKSESFETPFGAIYLETCAALAVEERRAPDAAQLVGAAEAVREKIGVPLKPFELGEYESLVAKIKRQIGEESFSRERLHGRTKFFLPVRRLLS